MVPLNNEWVPGVWHIVLIRFGDNREMDFYKSHMDIKKGVWVTDHYDNNREKYIETVKYYAEKFKKKSFSSKKALEWSISKGSYSGRTALQYVKNLYD